MLTPEKITPYELKRYKDHQQKIVMLTCYDASFARILERAGVDVILIGDSLGNVIQGHSSTVPVMLEHMIYHAKAVARSTTRPLRMVDMPFAANITHEKALEYAVQLMQAAEAHMIKIEGGAEIAPLITRCIELGIPVCAHLGLLPQHFHLTGRYSMQAKNEVDAQHLLETAAVLEEAGAGMLLVECIPDTVAARLQQQSQVPVIGIGSGVQTDGQVLVLYDILGISGEQAPKFSHNFLAETNSIQEAVQAYVDAVRQGHFPYPI